MIETITKYFFLTHIPITILIDLSPLYPNRGVFWLTHWLRQRYIEQFNDPLVGGQSVPGGWFSSLLFLEGAVQLPICMFISLQHRLGRHRSTSSRFMIVLYSVQVMTATWACIFECLAFDDSVVTRTQKVWLVAFYAPYLVIPILMAWSNSRALLTENTERDEELRYLRNKCRGAQIKHELLVEKNIVITGANSGVGFGTIQQLIAQNTVALRRHELQLNLFLTVRDQVKADSITRRLARDLRTYENGIKIEFIFMDLLSVASVEAAAAKLKTLLGSKRVSSLICNAGMAQFVKIDMYKALKQGVFHPIQAISEPNYKVQRVGGKSKDDLGATFQANVFGHYYLARRLQETGQLDETGKLLWMSSLEATANALKAGDLQALTHEFGYESSKRVMDILWHASKNTNNKSRPRAYCVHPGLCTTNIVADMVPNWLAPVWTWTFHLVRTMGLKFHVATAFNGAYAPALIAMHDDDEEYAQDAATVKYGSAMTWDGTSYVAPTRFDAIDEKQEQEVAAELDEMYNRWRARVD